MNIKEVAEKTYRIQVQIPNAFQTFTVHFIHRSKGVLIDPGPSSAIPAIQEAMRVLGMKDLAYIIPTHVHVDHAGAVGNLAQLFADARVVLHPLGKDHLVNPSSLITSTKMSYGEDFEKCLGTVLTVHDSQIDIVRDGETVNIEGGELQIIYAPGHAPHHIAILDLHTKGLFCGEALGIRTKSAPSSLLPSAVPPSFDMDVYMDTIAKLGKLAPRIIFFAHDGVSTYSEELISRASKNTELLGNIILKALRENHTAESIENKIVNYGLTDLGVNMREMDTRMVVQGFSRYFKKKGLA